MKHFFPLVPLLLLTCLAARGQGGGAPVGWLKLSADLPLHNRWSLYSEVESRQGNAQLEPSNLAAWDFGCT